MHLFDPSNCDTFATRLFECGKTLRACGPSKNETESDQDWVPLTKAAPPLPQQKTGYNLSYAPVPKWDEGFLLSPKYNGPWLS